MNEGTRPDDRQQTGAGRRRISLENVVAVLLIWAILATAAFGWAYFQDRVRSWDQEAALLASLRFGLSSSATAVDQFLETGDEAWIEAARGPFVNFRHAWFGGPGPGPAALTALGLNVSTLCTTAWALQIVGQRLAEDPNLLDPSGPEVAYLIQVRDLMRAVAAELADVRPQGVPPLDQLGEERVETIRLLTDELWTQGRLWYTGWPVC